MLFSASVAVAVMNCPTGNADCENVKMKLALPDESVIRLSRPQQGLAFAIAGRVGGTVGEELQREIRDRACC